MKYYLKLIVIPVGLMCIQKTHGTCIQSLTIIEQAKQNPEALKKNPRAFGAFKRSVASTSKKLSVPIKTAYKKLGLKRLMLMARRSFPKLFKQKCVQTPLEQKDLMVLSQWVKANVSSPSGNGSIAIGGHRKSSIPDAPPMPPKTPINSKVNPQVSNAGGRELTELERAVQNRSKRSDNRDRILSGLEQRNQAAFEEGGKNMVLNGSKPIGRHQKSMAQSLEEGDRKQGNLSKDQRIWHEEHARKEKAARDAELEALRGQGKVKNRNNG
jgi:hypothetical protein